MRETRFRLCAGLWKKHPPRPAAAPGNGKRRLKKALPALGLIPALVLLCCFTGPGKAVLAAATSRQLPIYCVEKSDKVCALTFDAAWGNEDTQQLIDILGKYRVRATFFVVGAWAEKYPDSVRALHDAGHEIMNHSDTHPHFPRLSADEMLAQINACSDRVAAVTGVRPTLFRAPYGDYDDRVILTVRGAGLEPIQWDVDSLDWKNPAPEKIVKRVLERVQPGSILLFHNAAKNTTAALPAVIEGLIRKGYAMVPVSELLLRGEYVMDHTGRQTKPK